MYLPHSRRIQELSVAGVPRERTEWQKIREILGADNEESCRPLKGFLASLLEEMRNHGRFGTEE